jgi:hypothetical protein
MVPLEVAADAGPHRTAQKKAQETAGDPPVAAGILLGVEERLTPERAVETGAVGSAPDSVNEEGTGEGAKGSPCQAPKDESCSGFRLGACEHRKSPDVCGRNLDGFPPCGPYQKGI